MNLILVAYQSRSLIDRQAGLSIESTRVPVDIVIPFVGAQVVVELAHLNGSLPAEVIFQLALFRQLVAQAREVEGLDLAGDVVEHGRVGRLRRGAKDVAVCFWRVGLARCLTGWFVSAPVAFLAGLAAIVGVSAAAAFAGARFRTGGIGADFGHDRI